MLHTRRYGRKAKGLIPFIIITVILCIVLEGFFYVEKKLRPALTTIAEFKANGIATDAINRAVLDIIAQGINYQDLIKVEQDRQGKIVMARLNTVEANRLLAETHIAIKDALTGMEKYPVKIPLGEILDSYILATYGPAIPIKFIPIGRINTELIDCFEDAGINQTRHKIYLKVSAASQIVIPFTVTPVIVETRVPITDTIYLGEVPEMIISLPNLQPLSP